MGQLYRLDFASGKSYIGITEKTAKGRFRGHAYSARNGSQLLVHRAWRKYGAPKLVVLAVLHNCELRAAEGRAVRVFMTYGSTGYNMTPGGDFHCSMSPEVRAMHSERMSGENNPCKRADVKAKLAAAMLGKTFSAERKAKISVALAGRKHSQNHILARVNSRAVNQVMKGKSYPSMARDQVGSANTFFGRKHSVEARNKISTANIGNKKASGKRSAASRKKMSDAHKGVPWSIKRRRAFSLLFLDA